MSRLTQTFSELFRFVLAVLAAQEPDASLQTDLSDGATQQANPLGPLHPGLSEFIYPHTVAASKVNASFLRIYTV